jgi:hypothetical protein
MYVFDVCCSAGALGCSLDDVVLDSVLLWLAATTPTIRTATSTFATEDDKRVVCKKYAVCDQQRGGSTQKRPC